MVSLAESFQDQSDTQISRRELLRASWDLVLAGLAITAYSAASEMPKILQPTFDSMRHLQSFLLAKQLLTLAPYSGETNKFTPTGEAIAMKIKDQFGVRIFSPKSWDGLSENMPWNERDLTFLDEALARMPNGLINQPWSPGEIVLLKDPYNDYPGLGGGNDIYRIRLYAGSGFDPNRQVEYEPDELALFSTDAQWGRATIIHEYIHGATANDPNLETDWANKIGWKLDSSGKWVNNRQNALIHHGNADKDPNEDIAVSGSLWATRRNFLSRDRINFFKSHSPFKSWKETNNH